MKAIGLIGRMSWESTVLYYQIISEKVKRRLGGLRSTKVILCSVESDETERCQPDGDWRKSGDILRAAAKSLEAADADFILICTNTIHKVVPQIGPMIQIPIIHIADTAAQELLAYQIRRVGLLGTKYMMTQDFYKQKLIDRDINVITPDAVDVDIVNDIIFHGLCVSNIGEESRRQSQIVTGNLKAKRVHGVILGCTEIGLLVHRTDLSLPVFNTTVVHAKQAVELALEVWFPLFKIKPDDLDNEADRQSGGYKIIDNWFAIDKTDSNTRIISEYRHWGEARCYLLNERGRSLLIDTGLGISNMLDEVVELTDRPITAVATHIHQDHIGGHKYFPDFYAHAEELDWLNGEFPLSIETIKEVVAGRCNLPNDFDVNDYGLFQGVPSKILIDHDIIDLGRRRVEVFHTPGHSPGHLCFWEKDTGYLFTGDLIYKDILLAYYPSTDPEAYLDSLKKISSLPVKEIFPAHRSLDIQPETLFHVRKAFEQFEANRKPHHGSGTFNYGDWRVWL